MADAGPQVITWFELRTPAGDAPAVASRATVADGRIRVTFDPSPLV